MGKLVLFLADGTTLDIQLDRERDHDRPPPRQRRVPAVPGRVSGEHAAVVTILADSFLEDLGSTNGTLVNGKPVAKHFLRDRDQIDIGKQKIVYVADESVQLEPDPPDVARRDVRLLAERVDAARARAALQSAGQDRRPPPEPAVDPELAALDAELRRDARVGERRLAARRAGARGDRRRGRRGCGGRGGRRCRGRGRSRCRPAESLALRRRRCACSTDPPPATNVALAKDDVTIGRPGRAVAAIRRTPAGRLLVPVEGGAGDRQRRDRPGRGPPGGGRATGSRSAASRWRSSRRQR